MDFVDKAVCSFTTKFARIEFELSSNTEKYGPENDDDDDDELFLQNDFPTKVLRIIRSLDHCRRFSQSQTSLLPLVLRPKYIMLYITVLAIEKKFGKTWV